MKTKSTRRVGDSLPARIGGVARTVAVTRALALETRTMEEPERAPFHSLSMSDRKVKADRCRTRGVVGLAVRLPYPWSRETLDKEQDSTAEHD